MRKKNTRMIIIDCFTLLHSLLLFYAADGGLVYGVTPSFTAIQNVGRCNFPRADLGGIRRKSVAIFGLSILGADLVEDEEWT